MNLILATLFHILVSPVLAMYGSVEPGGGPESACRLVISTSDDVIATMCSATLISSKEVATAAHCVEGVETIQGLKVRVDCGFIGYTTTEFLNETNLFGRPVWNKELQFKESITVDKIFTNSKGAARSVVYDTATLILSKPSELKATPVAIGVSASELSHCSTTGFGAGPVDRYVGRPFTGTYAEIESNGKMWRAAARVEQVRDDERLPLLSVAQAEDPTGAMMQFMVDREYLAFSTNGGDSGGGLICDVQGERRLVGVVRGATLEVNANKFTAGYFQLWAVYDSEAITVELYQSTFN